MYHVSAQGVDECMINVHYYYYYSQITPNHQQQRKYSLPPPPAHIPYFPDPQNQVKPHLSGSIRWKEKQSFFRWQKSVHTTTVEEHRQHELGKRKTRHVLGVTLEAPSSPSTTVSKKSILRTACCKNAQRWKRLCLEEEHFKLFEASILLFHDTLYFRSEFVEQLNEHEWLSDGEQCAYYFSRPFLETEGSQCANSSTVYRTTLATLQEIFWRLLHGESWCSKTLNEKAFLQLKPLLLCLPVSGRI